MESSISTKRRLKPLRAANNWDGCVRPVGSKTFKWVRAGTGAAHDSTAASTDTCAMESVCHHCFLAWPRERPDQFLRPDDCHGSRARAAHRSHDRASHLRPKRLIAPALTVAQLPPIDLILLSHAHMDHLHVATLRQFSAKPCVITAFGTGDLLRRTPMKDVRELSWGGRASVSTHHGEIRIEAFEVKHWGARWRHDVHRGYNGYILERNNRKILFGGDTAYCESFKKLRSKGPFDLAIMPIGAYQCGQISSHARRRKRWPWRTMPAPAMCCPSTTRRFILDRNM